MEELSALDFRAASTCFAANDKYLCAASGRKVLIVSVETGEVVQSVSPPLGAGACVTAVAAGGETPPHKLHVGDSDGYVTTWDVESAEMEGRVGVGAPVAHLRAHPAGDSVLLACTQYRSASKPHWQLVAVSVAEAAAEDGAGPHGPVTAPVEVLVDEVGLCSALAVAEDGAEGEGDGDGDGGGGAAASRLSAFRCAPFAAVATGGRVAYLFRSRTHTVHTVQPSPSQDLLSAALCTADAGCGVLLAVGDASGVVWLLRTDHVAPAAASVLRREGELAADRAEAGADPGRRVDGALGAGVKPRRHAWRAGADVRYTRLHWHLAGVRALAFAHGTRFLVSGGEEAVLVTWHVGASTRGFLPRLGAPVAAVASSADGTRYAVALQDNSVRLVGAAENQELWCLRGVSIASPAVPLRTRRAAAGTLCTDPRTGAVVITGAHGSGALQFWDAAADRHMMELEVAPRLAVFRTASLGSRDRGSGPGRGVGTERVEPVVVERAAFACDGSGMVTVEVWRNPRAGAGRACVPAGVQPAGPRREAAFPWTVASDRFPTTCALKFWHWDGVARKYRLNTRVDDPHSGAAAGVVTCLEYHPRRHSALTCGADGSLRLWGRMKRPRDAGSQLRQRAAAAAGESAAAKTLGEDESVWACRAVLQWGDQPALCAAFSADGDVIAAGHTGCVTFWDARRCALLRAVPSGEAVRGIHFLGDSPFVVARTASRLSVLDLRLFTVAWSVALATTALAVDPEPMHVPAAPGSKDRVPVPRFAVTACHRSSARRRDKTDRRTHEADRVSRVPAAGFAVVAADAAARTALKKKKGQDDADGGGDADAASAWALGSNGAVRVPPPEVELGAEGDDDEEGEGAAVAWPPGAENGGADAVFVFAATSPVCLAAAAIPRAPGSDDAAPQHSDAAARDESAQATAVHWLPGRRQRGSGGSTLVVMAGDGRLLRLAPPPGTRREPSTRPAARTEPQRSNAPVANVTGGTGPATPPQRVAVAVERAGDAQAKAAVRSMLSGPSHVMPPPDHIAGPLLASLLPPAASALAARGENLQRRLPGNEATPAAVEAEADGGAGRGVDSTDLASMVRAVATLLPQGRGQEGKRGTGSGEGKPKGVPPAWLGWAVPSSEEAAAQSKRCDLADMVAPRGDGGGGKGKGKSPAKGKGKSPGKKGRPGKKAAPGPASHAKPRTERKRVGASASTEAAGTPGKKRARRT